MTLFPELAGDHPGLQQVAELLSKHRFRFTSEMELQAGIALVLETHGVLFQREYVISNADRLDFFLLGGLAIEVKIDGTLMQALRQVSRYANHPEILGILLIGTPRWLPEVPPALNSKPVQGLRLLGSML